MGFIQSTPAGVYTKGGVQEFNPVSAGASKRTVAAFGRLIANAQGPSNCRRRLLMSLAHCKLLYASSIWALTAAKTARSRTSLSQTKRRPAISGWEVLQKRVNSCPIWLLQSRLEYSLPTFWPKSDLESRSASPKLRRQQSSRAGAGGYIAHSQKWLLSLGRSCETKQRRWRGRGR